MSPALARGTWCFLAGVATAACLAATFAPLATYALTLAAFGLVHVLAELRYVDRRFSARLPPRLLNTWLALIGVIVLVRLVGLATDAAPMVLPAIEVALVGLLALTALPVLRRAATWKAAVAVVLGGLLLAGAVLAPLATLVLLAVLHNLTPIGFLLERLDGAARRRMVLGVAVLFGVVPLAVAAGVPTRVLAGLDSGGVLGAGPLADQLGTFVPAAWRGGDFAVRLFAAAAYLQCMHYAVVIGVLPRLEPAGAARIIWPARRTWVTALCVVAGVGFAVFAWSFRDARALYGLFALVHAWIEVPVLLAALAPLPGRA
ncbi:MAG: hypothetical protein O2894_02155 [Planctomycetota bacterium]|nr:hypothetical protein [Planctomycetota bacterium]